MFSQNYDTQYEMTILCFDISSIPLTGKTNINAGTDIWPGVFRRRQSDCNPKKLQLSVLYYTCDSEESGTATPKVKGPC